MVSFRSGFEMVSFRNGFISQWFRNGFVSQWFRFAKYSKPSHPSNVSFDLITIIILISIINDLCHHLRPSSQQYLAIPNNFYGQTTSNANICIKINCRRPAHFFVCSSSALFSKRYPV